MDNPTNSNNCRLQAKIKIIKTMLCYIIDRTNFELCYKQEYNTHKDIGTKNNAIFIGSITSINDAEDIAKYIPCFTEIKILGNKVKSCFIICH